MFGRLLCFIGVHEPTRDLWGVRQFGYEQRIWRKVKQWRWRRKCNRCKAYYLEPWRE